MEALKGSDEEAATAGGTMLKTAVILHAGRRLGAFLTCRMTVGSRHSMEDDAC